MKKYTVSKSRAIALYYMLEKCKEIVQQENLLDGHRGWFDGCLNDAFRELDEFIEREDD